MVCVFIQLEVSQVQSAVDDAHFPVEVTGNHMRPVVVLEKLDLTR